MASDAGLWVSDSRLRGTAFGYGSRAFRACKERALHLVARQRKWKLLQNGNWRTGEQLQQQAAQFATSNHIPQKGDLALTYSVCNKACKSGIRNCFSWCARTA